MTEEQQRNMDLVAEYLEKVYNFSGKQQKNMDLVAEYLEKVYNLSGIFEELGLAAEGRVSLSGLRLCSFLFRGFIMTILPQFDGKL